MYKKNLFKKAKSNYLSSREKNSTKERNIPLFILRQAIHEITPDITVKARYVGESTHQAPIEKGFTRGKILIIH